MPNFTQIGQMVWISIRYEQIYIYILCFIYQIYIYIYVCIYTDTDTHTHTHTHTHTYIYRERERERECGYSYFILKINKRTNGPNKLACLFLAKLSCLECSTVAYWAHSKVANKINCCEYGLFSKPGNQNKKCGQNQSHLEL